eukprot:scaffold61921_cov69-Phaeocystis_antarctica.AAC.9
MPQSDSRIKDRLPEAAIWSHAALWARRMPLTLFCMGLLLTQPSAANTGLTRIERAPSEARTSTRAWSYRCPLVMK